MSSSHEQPEQRGVRMPEVVVRAGKTYVCSSCGTLVEIPADVVGQLVNAVDPMPQEVCVGEPSAEEPPAHAEPVSKVSTHHEPQPQPVLIEEPAPRSTLQGARPARPKRPRQPKRDAFTNTIIDGLRVPSAKELDRALTWVSFHLKVLDRQGSEITRLKKLLKKQSTAQVSRPSLPGRVKEVIRQEPTVPGIGETQKHAQADLGVAPASCQDIPNKRGPP
ncbi:hypothetical protein [Bremerella sp. P1]|uniref:hypothetical protein n=1 Tax=Bremerella sp. P1 TaxID=3026424 RepID=UPI0023674DE9|nr:hypothetical protein [Bremerella sp. P1]WDI40258.1 hypothetical protein PSR63_17395 [Bremerella sp. P1]